MFNVEKSIKEAQRVFDQLIEYIRHDSQLENAYTVEKNLFKESMKINLHLLAAYFEAKEGGNIGKSLTIDSGEILSRERLKDRRYLCVFGELKLKRYYYHTDGIPGVIPLDEDTNLPKRTYSYFLQELAQRRVGKMAYDEAIKEIEELFGCKIPMRSLEQMIPETSCDVDGYYQRLGTPKKESEEEILVAAIDGKGVPMVKEGPAEKKTRLGKGEKRNKKKEAVVASVYSIGLYQRTAEDVLREVCEEESPSKRPKPQNKRVRASLAGKQNTIEWAQEEVTRRNSSHQKKRVCIMDGAVGLWKIALKTLKGFTFVLDLFHVLEYLWKAAYIFHQEGSDEAESFVRVRLKMLLEGKAGYLIGGLRQMLSKHKTKLNASQRKTLKTVIGYYERNRKWMKYDQYIEAGYPIGSGVVEGACRHLVKDRMEGSGMRWTIKGAEAVLKLRAVLLNGDWDEFWKYHMEQEKRRRFGNRYWEPVQSEKHLKLAA